MSAHSVGAANRSQRQLERQRETLFRQAMSRRDEREHYLQALAEKLSAECSLPLSVARQRVERLSVAANTEREREIERSILSFARYG
jgi:hypothetical protein